MKIDVTSGAMIWEFSLGNTATAFGAKSGYETIAFTSDGGFVVGGFGGYTNGDFPTFKSGGQLDNGTPIMEKFDSTVASAASMPTAPTAVWTWVCGTGNSCAVLGSMKSIRVYTDNGVEKVVGVPGKRTAIAIAKESDGASLQFADIDNAAANGVGTANDIEVVKEGDRVLGFVTTGLDFSAIDCPDGGENCSRIGGAISKFTADLNSEPIWNTRFNNFAGGVDAYASVTDEDLGEALILTECWGLMQYDGLFIASCGQGIEGCASFTGSVATACNADPRINWRGTTVAVDGSNGAMQFYRTDNLNDQSSPVGSSAFEYIVPYPNRNGFVQVSDETAGFGYATYKFPNTQYAVGDYKKCWQCFGAASYADCQANGAYQTCSEKDSCALEVRKDNNGNLINFSTGCFSDQYCNALIASNFQNLAPWTGQCRPEGNATWGPQYLAKMGGSICRTCFSTCNPDYDDTQCFSTTSPGVPRWLTTTADTYWDPLTAITQADWTTNWVTTQQSNLNA